MSKYYLQFMSGESITRLLEIARCHCKLALEHSKANTLPARREAIRGEIEALRAERDTLISNAASTLKEAII